MSEVLTPTPLAVSSGTAVTATLIDTWGRKWAFATVNIFLVPPLPASNPYQWNGGFFSMSPTITADANGYFSIILPLNSDITPAPNKWRFSISPAGSFGVNPTVFDVVVSGSSPIDVSSTFTANSGQSSIGTVQSLPVPIAPSDGDVATPPNVGQLYYNTTNNALMVFSGPQVPPNWKTVYSPSSVPIPSADANDLQNGNYYSWGFTNIPPTLAGLLVSISVLGNFQFVHGPETAVYYRAYNNDTNTWSNWQQIMGVTVINTTTDLNTLITTGTYILSYATNTPNPAMNSYGAIVEVWTPGFAFDGNTTNWTQRLSLPNTGWPVPELYYRIGFTYASSPTMNWGPWFNVAMTQVS